MKKTYKQPITKAIDIDMTEMIAQSDTPAPNSIEYGGSNADGGPSAAESKSSNSLWDVEW